MMKQIWGLDLNGLYISTPERVGCKIKDPYKYGNFTYRVKKGFNGNYYMVDTFRWGGLRYPITPSNIRNFSFLFDFDEVRRCSREEWNLYDDKDKFRIPLDEGWRECFVMKDAKPSPKKIAEAERVKARKMQAKKLVG